MELPACRDMKATGYLSSRTGRCLGATCVQGHQGDRVSFITHGALAWSYLRAGRRRDGKVGRLAVWLCLGPHIQRATGPARAKGRCGAKWPLGPASPTMGGTAAPEPVYGAAETPARLWRFSRPSKTETPARPFRHRAPNEVVGDSETRLEKQAGAAQPPCTAATPRDSMRACRPAAAATWIASQLASSHVRVKPEPRYHHAWCRLPAPSP